MTPTMLIWFNPDVDLYEIGKYKDYRFLSRHSTNRDRFEILFEFCEETVEVSKKVLRRLNKVKMISYTLNV